MAGPALDYAYRYPFESSIASASKSTAPSLRLATFTEEEVNPYFFAGRLLQPFKVAKLLQGLVHLVRTRFFVHQAMLPAGIADPIITAHEDFLRFEVFSGCCSVYARLDLPPNAIDGDTLGCGTTNVDFNPALVAALAKIRSTDKLEFNIGADEFVLERESAKVVEKRVQLPIRWLKGLVAATSFGKQMELRHEISGAHATRFLRSIPRVQDHRSRWSIQSAGQSLRISQRPGKHPDKEVMAGGLNRLRVLEDLTRFADKLRVYGHNEVEASCWELDCGDARFSMMMTHNVWRGFSGEGQGLEALAIEVPDKILKKTRASLKWQSIVDPNGLANKLISTEDLESGLAVLSTQGHVGFDVGAGHYFHRELPFDLEMVTKLQPRLKGAQKLLDQGNVTSTGKKSNHSYSVKSTDTTHTVQLLECLSKCTCPWYAKHQGRRGPCKHVLAAQIFESNLQSKEA